jgi:endonuclease YncB( thermonuclease family)
MLQYFVNKNRGLMMKKFLISIIVLMTFLLSSCTNECNNNGCYELPDLTGYKVAEITVLFDELDANYTIQYSEDENPDKALEFIQYDIYSVGETIQKETEVIIIAYPAITIHTVILPGLFGFTMDEVSAELDALDISYSFEYVYSTFEVQNQIFKSYKNHLAYDEINHEESIIVEIYLYQEEVVDAIYFSPVEMVYDGPYLDESFATIDYLNPRGGYFEVTLNYCTDGDTAVFHYPQDVFDAITSNAKSTRFLNMDTEETYSGGEEEWGKPASVYTCELLENAESIIIQTDPNDGLLGNYGRLLGWIWIQLSDQEEYFLLNYMVVKQGLAQVKYEFGAGETIYYGDHSYNEWMHIAEDYAIENQLGQWGDLLDYYWDYENDQPEYQRW